MAEWITGERAAEILGVTRPTVVKMIADGRLQPLNYVNGRIAVFDADYIRKMKGRVAVANVGGRVAKLAPTG